MLWNWLLTWFLHSEHIRWLPFGEIEFGNTHNLRISQSEKEEISQSIIVSKLKSDTKQTLHELSKSTTEISISESISFNQM